MDDSVAGEPMGRGLASLQSRRAEPAKLGVFRAGWLVFFGVVLPAGTFLIEAATGFCARGRSFAGHVAS